MVSQQLLKAKGLAGCAAQRNLLNAQLSQEGQEKKPIACAKYH